MKRRALTPSEIAAFSPGLSNPDFKIAGCRAGAEETGNPFYIWLAAEICIATKREFPGWVLDYLKQCAVRMRSPEARKHSDLRKMLPWVLGFPSKGKRGPGNPLDPDLGRPHLHFVLQFSAYIYCGVDPTTALHEACNDVFEDDDINDATLQRWVKKHYGLKTWPRTFDEWREVILRQYPRERLARWFGMAAQGYGIGRDKNPFRKALKTKTIISRNPRWVRYPERCIASLLLPTIALGGIKGDNDARTTAQATRAEMEAYPRRHLAGSAAQGRRH